MLASGTRLGPYEIVAPLGAGGMGEVYRARDTRLARDVAVKVLPPHLSREPEVRARFEREARSISSLNHPHICVLHDVGREGDTDYLVMELVEGETLSARLAKGALPLVEVLRLGSQVADALARAHRAGVVHRDLKPGNIMVTRSGAKLMDFGLARSSRGTPNAAELTQAPTETSPITGEGRILGTVPYMAPEQFEGREADTRSDIWALGCVLYEMATGTRAFGGGSAASVMSAILRDEPAPLSERAPASPPALERLIRSCLAKDPNERWQSAGDLARELAWMAGGGEAVGAGAPSRRGAGMWLALAALLVVVAFAAALQLTGRAPWGGGPRRQTWSTLDFPPEISSQCLINGNYALSPDGARVVSVVADSSGMSRLMSTGLGRLLVRALSRSAWAPLAPDEEAISPFWSPDSREIGFVNSEGKLERVSAAGGAPQFICKAGTEAWGVSWGVQGWIVFGFQAGGPIMKVRASGGVPEPAVVPDSSRHEKRYLTPEFLPDGRHFLFAVQPGASPGNLEIRVGSIDGIASHPLMIAQGTPKCDGRGNIVFMRANVLYRQGIDDKGDRLRGVPIQLEESPQRRSGFPGPVTSVAGDRLVYVPADDRPTDFVWFRRDGLRLERAAAMRVPVERPVLSPDGFRVLSVVGNSPGVATIWLTDLATGAQRCLTDPEAFSVGPRWTSSGQRLTYHAFRSRKSEEVLRMDPDAPESTRVIATRGWAACSVPGDRQVVLVVPGAAIAWSPENPDLVVHDVTGATPDRGYATSPANESDCILFDGGRHAAFVSDASGRSEIYCDDFPTRRHTVQLTYDGCMYSHPAVPRFWVAGNEVFYLAAGSTVRSVTLRREGGSFVRGEAHTLFDLPLDHRQLTTSPDGQRFLVALPAGGYRPASLTLVENWDAAPAAR